jgi:hypothetical protein
MMKKLLFLFLFLISVDVFAASAANPKQHSPNAPITISVTGSSTQGIPYNQDRTGLDCINVGTANVSISFNGAAVVNYGITLEPAMYFNMDDYDFSTAAMNVISPATSTLSCQEYQ